MPLSPLLPAVLAIALIMTLWRFSYSFLHDRNFNLFPSLGWGLFMLFPLLLEWTYFTEPYRMIHAIGVLSVWAMIFTADIASQRHISKQFTGRNMPITTNKFHDRVAWVSTAILVSIAVFHLITANSIPLYNFLFDQQTASQILELRNNFQRDMTAPLYLRFFINFNVYIFGSIAIMLHWDFRRYKLCFALIIGIILYSLLSTAKMPAVIALAIFVFLYLERLCVPYPFILRIAFVILTATFVSVFAFYYLTKDKIMQQYDHPVFLAQKADDPRITKTLGDYIRSPEADIASAQYSKPYRQLEYLIYRAFLTPIEVSDRWYQYYTYESKNFESPLSLLKRANGAEDSHPAIKVGRWAYSEKFPTKYAKSIHAYGSLDADAYAYGGLYSVFVFGFLFALSRFLLAFFLTHNSIAHTLYFTALVLMTLIPPNGSLLALLGPHGLLFILGTLSLFWGYEHRGKILKKLRFK